MLRAIIDIDFYTIWLVSLELLTMSATSANGCNELEHATHTHKHVHIQRNAAPTQVSLKIYQIRIISLLELQHEQKYAAMQLHWMPPRFRQFFGGLN